eukprot:1158818-Pelagomonas_calceolata.AAC.13
MGCTRGPGEMSAHVTDAEAACSSWTQPANTREGCNRLGTAAGSTTKPPLAAGACSLEDAEHEAFYAAWPSEQAAAGHAAVYDPGARGPGCQSRTAVLAKVGLHAPHSPRGAACRSWPT